MAAFISNVTSEGDGSCPSLRKETNLGWGKLKHGNLVIYLLAVSQMPRLILNLTSFRMIYTCMVEK